MDRRRFLYVSGTLASVGAAGCLGDGAAEDRGRRAAASVDTTPEKGEPSDSESLLFAVTPEKLWSYETADEVRASATVVDGRAYVGSLDGHVYAFAGDEAERSDGGTGFPMFKHDLRNTNAPGTPGPREGVERTWRVELGGEFHSGPAVADGALYIGSTDGRLHRLDGETGDVAWSIDLGRAIPQTPTVDDGTVYVGAGGSFDAKPERPGAVVAVDADDGEVLWSHATDEGIIAPPAVADGLGFFGSPDHRFYAVDVASGETVWTFDGADDTYCGGQAGVRDGTVYACNHDNHLYALDAATGEERWRFETGDKTSSSPVVTDDAVYFGALDGNLYCADAESGDERWRFETDGPIASSPGYEDGVVYVGSYDSNVYAVNAATGDPVWTYETGEWVLSSPLVTESTVYVGSGDGNLYAIENAVDGDDPGPDAERSVIGE